jgi:hypothetical protein
MWKRSFLILLPAAVFLAPSLWHKNADWWERAKELLIPVTTSDGAPPPPAPPPTSPTHAADLRAAPATPNTAKKPPAGESFDDVFRFDIVPEWIINRWRQVTPGLSQLELQGYRVPLVTGTAVDDLAGSLTYYFNARQQVQRISFQGTTGDAGRLIRFLAGRYQFGRRMTKNPGLVRYEVARPTGPPASALDIRLARPDDRLRRYDLMLLIERPE